MGDESIAPFRVEVTEEEIEDLRRRINQTRWPDRETASGWDQGTPLAYAQELSAYWANDYDMTRVASRLNRYPQYRTNIDGIDIHFLHVRSPHEGATPLVLTHGWPGSVLEYVDVIDALTNPTAHGGSAADAFHVVIPSLPGHGYSGKPTETGWNLARIGRAWTVLMGRLGYARFGAQGGDWGGLLTTVMAVHDPEHVIGVHLTVAMASAETYSAFPDLSEFENAALENLQRIQQTGVGYFAIQSTKPQSLGYGLNDSPVGQLSWIVEKFQGWTDNDGLPDSAVDRDEILDDVTLYWLTGTATSSARLYWEVGGSVYVDLAPTRVPVAYSVFPQEMSRLSERWARRRFPDLRHYRALPAGGHFASLEQRDALVEEVRAGFRAILHGQGGAESSRR